MPGGYPDAPTQRLAYDLDQTQIFWIRNESNTLITTYNSTTIDDLNNEHSARNISESQPGHTVRNQWLFPGPRDLFGVWAAGDGDEGVEPFFTGVETSGDTRSWNTGTWSLATAGFSDTGLLWDRWRRDVQTFTANEQWGLRGYSGAQGGFEFVGKLVRQVHIYGAVTDAYYPDRVIVLDDDTGLELTLHDWGYNPRGTIQTKVLQVRNNSTTLAATGVTLGFNSLNDHNPAAWHELRDGVGAYASSLNLGTLGAGTIYANDITMRITVPSDAGMGPWTNRLLVGVAAWAGEVPFDGESIGEGYVEAWLYSPVEFDGASTGEATIVATLTLLGTNNLAGTVVAVSTVTAELTVTGDAGLSGFSSGFDSGFGYTSDFSDDFSDDFGA